MKLAATSPLIIHDFANHNLNSQDEHKKFKLYPDNPEPLSISERTSLKTPNNSKEETNDHNPSWDDLSALAVAGAFATTIAAVASGKAEFGLKTIATVGGAEAIRMTGLFISNKEAWSHERNEHTVSLPVAFGLAVMAETADNVRAYVDSLFEEDRFSEEIAEVLVLEETHLGKHRIDPLKDKSLKECEEYLELHKDEVLRLVAGNTALTSILAPVATTYTAASAAADSFAPLTRALTKAYFAQETIRLKDAGVVDYDEDDLAKTSLNKAIEQMNDQDGFCNLSLAVTANTSGMSLIGDPPLVFSFILNRSIPNHLLLSGEGLAFSEAVNAASTSYWLNKTGLGLESSDYLKKFSEYSARSISALASSPFGQKTREAAYAGYKRHSEDLTQKLDALGQSGGITDENINRLREYMQSLEHPIVQIDVPRLIDIKSRAIKRIISKRLNGHISIEEVEESERLLQSLRSKDETEKIENLSALSRVFLKLLTAPNGNGNLIEELSKVAPLVDEFGPQKIARKLEGSLSDGKLSSKDVIGLEKIVGILGPEEVKVALNSSLEQYRGVIHERVEEDAFFGHTSEEVLNALWTQLPAVPSLVHNAEKIIPKLLGTKSLEEVTSEQADKATFLVLSATAAISSTADNVAAYLFGKKLLEDIYQKTYGETYEGNKGLRQFANDAPLIAAIIGGSLSRIGNGPNFMINKVEATIKDGTVDVGKKPLTLGSSYVNPYAWTQSLAAIGLLMAQKKSGAFASF